MSVSVTYFEPDKHYEEVSKWWELQKWPVIPLSHLPNIGFVVSKDATPAAAGWLYQTDSAFCLFEWIVANPEIRKDPRTECINALIESAKTTAANLGFKTIFMSVRNESLLKRLESNGFSVTDKRMTNLVFSVERNN